MTLDVVLAAFAITTLGMVFCAVPIYCLVGASDLFGRLDHRDSHGQGVAVPRSSPESSQDVIENDCVLRFPARRVPVRMNRAVLTEERVDQLAS